MIDDNHLYVSFTKIYIAYHYDLPNGKRSGDIFYYNFFFCFQMSQTFFEPKKYITSHINISKHCKILELEPNIF